MAEIPIRTAVTDGVNLNLGAAASGDTAKCGDDLTLIVANGSGGSVTVTFDVVGNTSYGVAAPDKVITVPAGQTVAVPLLEAYRDPADRLAHITWGSTASVTRAVLKR